MESHFTSFHAWILLGRFYDIPRVMKLSGAGGVYGYCLLLDDNISIQSRFVIVVYGFVLYHTHTIIVTTQSYQQHSRKERPW